MVLSGVKRRLVQEVLKCTGRFFLISTPIPFAWNYFIEICKVYSKKPVTNKFELFLRNVFLQYSYPYLKPDIRLQFQRKAMGSGIGVDWANYYLNSIEKFPPSRGSVYVGELEYYQAHPILEFCVQTLKENPITRFVQLGCSSGREISYFASLSENTKFIGTEIDSQMVNFLQATYKKNNLEFVECLADEVEKYLPQKSDDRQQFVVMSSGSLQYVFPENLEIFFSKLSKIKNCRLMLLEPATFQHHDPLKISGSVVRGTFSYAHNYSYYAKKSGLKVELEEVIKPYKKTETPSLRTYSGHYWGVYYT